MRSIFDNIKDELIKGIKNVSQKTTELTAIGRIKIEILTNTRDLEKAFIEIGKIIYLSSKKNSLIDLKSDQQIASLIKRVRELEKKLEKLNIKMEKIRME